jgi:hypothetical protein
MADEQAPVEQTAVEETQEQTIETSGTPVEDTPGQSEGGKGDLSIALKQEREARQALEARLADPQFIYQQARQLGLTEEEAQAQVESQSTAFSPTPPSNDAYAQYQYFQALDKAREKYPQLSEDEDDQLAVTALMSARGLNPLQAAERYYSKINKVADVARTEGAKLKETVITEKEQATTVTSTQSTSSEAAVYEELLARSRNQMNPKEANKAHLELLKWRETHKS